MRIILAFAALLIGACPAFAHKLHVDARVAGDQVRVEAYYDDDTPAQQAKIAVLKNDVVIAEGRTDDKGVWTCAKPPAGTYTVRAENLGHAAKETLVLADTVAGPPPPQLSAADDSNSMPPSDRESRTATPWRRLGLGLGLIAGVTLVSLLLRRRGKS
jgi:hypothetical protein